MDMVRAYYVAIAAIGAAIVWILFKAAPIRQRNDFDEAVEPPKTRTPRDDLIEARERVTRQIEILQNSRRDSLSRQSMGQLKTILAEIEAELGPSEPG